MQNTTSGRFERAMNMMKVIKTDAEYHDALARIEDLMDHDPDEETRAANELEVLSLLIEDYESNEFPSSLPDPIDAIKFRMEQQNLAQRDLIPYIGSRSKVSEVLSGKRQLTLSMIRALHANLGIPAKVLLQERDASVLKESDIDWSCYPVHEVVKRGWIEAVSRNARDDAEELMRDFFSQLGNVNAAVAMFRKSDHIRSARSMDEYALVCWSVQVVIKARQNPPKATFKQGTVDLDFMRNVARLSWSDNGPLLAQEFLAKHGIPLIIEPHLPRTYLDGAAILVESDRPIIGLSVRHDRIDNFWWCLMHELAHIALHLDTDVSRFFDDLDVENQGDKREEEADDLAGEALIPRDAWEASPAKNFRSAQSAEHLAKNLGIHPAIVAGYMRHHFNNYRILNQLVGHRKVRKLFQAVQWSE
ncbi:MAG: ImmA/IrrE family metallo-endopeptidase [Planctomycetota bacterium]